MTLKVIIERQNINWIKFSDLALGDIFGIAEQEGIYIKAEPHINDTSNAFGFEWNGLLKIDNTLEVCLYDSTLIATLLQNHKK